MNYDTRHGGPYDRAEQITQYTAGFREAEADGSQKDWG